jgi:branched-chain amino acid transport system ATP-binding protein
MTLQLERIRGGYGDTLVHRDLSLTVASGEVVAIVGRNGTGKTTLARLITGELPLAGGAIQLQGATIGGLGAWARARRGLVSLPQTGMVFDTLTVRENLMLTGAEAAQIAAVTQRFPRLAERQSQRAGSMSGGERKILGFARAMLARGGALILDEPSEGVQPENIHLMQALITERKRSGDAVLLMEQNISMILAIADRVLALDVGGFTFTLERHEIHRAAVLAALEI